MRLIELLTRANATIGYYDHLRYGEIEKDCCAVNGKVIHNASRQVRKINETRSEIKNRLDRTLSNYVS